MGILTRSLGIRNLSMEDPAQPLLPPSALFESLGLGRSDAGVLINERQALRIPTAQACIKVISEDLSRLSLDVFQRMPDDSIRVAREHRCYPILHDRPSPSMSSMTWRGAQLACALAWGNSYSWIKRDGAARVIALVPLASDKTAPVKVNGEFAYATTQTDTGQAIRLDPANVLHFMGLSIDGILGLSPIQLCKNAFGLTAAAEKFGAQFFGNGARATGVFSHPGGLEPEAYENLKKSIREWATGDQALRPIILEEGMKWEQITIPPNDAQFILTRQFQRSEIAALFRVPMHLLQDLQSATNNNIEHQGLDYTRFCLAPWAVRMEQEINYKLLGGGGKFFCEHNMAELQRGDFAAQTAGFATLRNIGVYSSNHILRDMRQNPVPAEEGGDLLIVQGAMIPLKALMGTGDDVAPPPTDEADSDAGNPAAGVRRVQIVAQYRRLFRDAVGRIVNRETRDAKFIRSALNPSCASMAQAMIAMRFGGGELTHRETATIDALLAGFTDAAASWAKTDGAAISARVTEQVYSALAGEILAND